MISEKKTPKKTIMVKNPYTNKEVNIEPLLRLLAEEKGKFQLNVCRSMMKLHLEVMAKHGTAWYDELEVLNRLVETFTEIEIK